MNGRRKPKPDDRRDCGRLRIEQLTCELGHVVNLSGSGMRVLAKTSAIDQVGETLDLTLSGIAQSTDVKCKIVWSKRTGFRKHLVGFTFVDLAEDDRRHLTALAQDAVFLPGLGNQNVKQARRAKAA